MLSSFRPLIALTMLGLGFTFTARSPLAAQATFLRGDANGDGQLSISDALMIRRFLFNQDIRPACMDSADADDDGRVIVNDLTTILVRIFFQDGPAIPQPFPTLGLDPTPNDDLTCEIYAPVPPEATDDVIRIGDVSAGPGDDVSIPVYLTNSVEVEAIQLVVSYDPTRFTPSTDEDGINLTGGPWKAPFAFQQLTPSVADGLFRVGVMGSMVGKEASYAPIPPGTDTLVFRIVGKVSADAEPGSRISLVPTNGPDGQGSFPPLGLKNEISHKGEARFVSTLPITKGGTVAIIDDITFFTRGDGNGDGLVDVSDAVFIINYLYLAGAAPRCLDAADADDNGAIEITDPVVILGGLFSQGLSIAPPYPERGGDLTPDSLPPCH